MSKKLDIIWIDDLPDRKDASDNLAEAINARANFISVKGEDLNTKLKEVLSGSQPDLLIIDHKLENVKGIFETGSTMVEFIREQWPECPIICMTGVEKNQLVSRSFSTYDAVFEIEDIGDSYFQVSAIAQSFRKLRTDRPTTTEEFIKLLKAPSDDRIKLESILPHEVKTGFDTNGYILHASNWIRHILIARPGFLYDRLWTATLLGLKEKSFKKVESVFEKAKYTGLFANETDERWWKSDILRILNNKVDELGLPWEKGRKLSAELRSTDFSKCHVSKKEFPETVAFVDETDHASQVPVRLQDSIPHPAFESLLYFEELRMIKPA